jgi:biopolymer transport protein ExbD
MQYLPGSRWAAAVAGCFLLAACGNDAPEPPRVVAALTVSIDAASSCSLERQPVECGEVAAMIQSRYPTSKPRVDICLDKEARFEAAAEVMKSIADSGFTVGNFDCARAGTTG